MEPGSRRAGTARRPPPAGAGSRTGLNGTSLCPGGGKGLQRFGVGKAERLIPRHRDFNTLFFVFLFDLRCCRGRLLTEESSFFPMDIFFGSLCQQGDLLL